MKLFKNQKGALGFEVMAVIAIVAVVAAFTIYRVADKNSDVAKSDSSPEVVAAAELEDHLDVSEASETIEVPEVVAESSEDTEKIEVPSLKPESTTAVDAPNTTEDLEVVEEEEPAVEVIKDCPVKGSETLVTFYPSDYTLLNVFYDGDVSMVKGGSSNCGIMRMTVGSHYESARVVIDVNSELFEQTVPFVEGERYSICSEVRFKTENPGYGHDVPENIGFLYLVSEVSNEFSVHCSEFTHRNFDNGYGDAPSAIILSLHNNAFDDEGTPVEGAGVQTVDIRRMTVQRLEAET